MKRRLRSRLFATLPAGLRNRLLPLISESNLRDLRQRLPYPGLWALCFGKARPALAFATADLGLERPESIDVSVSGDRFVVSNSAADEIAVYALARSPRGHYRISRVAALQDTGRFRYAHGAVFGRSDDLVVAVGEYSHALSGISLGRTADGEIQPEVLWTISGRDYSLHNPADLAFHPSGEWMAVANRRNHGVSFLRFRSPAGIDPPFLEGSLDLEALNTHGVAAPHGVAFSAGGELMFVTHKRYFGGPEDTGRSALTVFPTGHGPALGERAVPLVIRDYQLQSLHHVACHPTRNIVAVTNSLGTIDIYAWRTEPFCLELLAAVPAFRIGEGIKGIAFTRDGAFMVVTSELNEILFFPLDALCPGASS